MYTHVISSLLHVPHALTPGAHHFICLPDLLICSSRCASLCHYHLDHFKCFNPAPANYCCWLLRLVPFAFVQHLNLSVCIIIKLVLSLHLSDLQFCFDTVTSLTWASVFGFLSLLRLEHVSSSSRLPSLICASTWSCTVVTREQLDESLEGRKQRVKKKKHLLRQQGSTNRVNLTSHCRQICML